MEKMFISFLWSRDPSNAFSNESLSTTRPNGFYQLGITLVLRVLYFHHCNLWAEDDVNINMPLSWFIKCSELMRLFETTSKRSICFNKWRSLNCFHRGCVPVSRQGEHCGLVAKVRFSTRSVFTPSPATSCSGWAAHIQRTAWNDRWRQAMLLTSPSSFDHAAAR